MWKIWRVLVIDFVLVRFIHGCILDFVRKRRTGHAKSFRVYLFQIMLKSKCSEIVFLDFDIGCGKTLIPLKLVWKPFDKGLT